MAKLSQRVIFEALRAASFTGEASALTEHLADVPGISQDLRDELDYSARQIAELAAEGHRGQARTLAVTEAARIGADLPARVTRTTTEDRDTADRIVARGPGGSWRASDTELLARGRRASEIVDSKLGGGDVAWRER